MDDRLAYHHRLAFFQLAHRLSHRFALWLALCPLVLVLGIAPSQAAQKSAPGTAQGYTVSASEFLSSGKAGFSAVRVTVELSPAVAATFDEEFTVTILKRAYRSPNESIKGSLTIASGSSSGFVELYVPMSNQNRSQELLVERGVGDGRFDPGTDILQQQMNSVRSYSVAPSILVFSSKFKGHGGMAWVATSGQPISAVANTKLTGGGELPSYELLSAAFEPDSIATQGVPSNKMNLLTIETEEYLQGCNTKTFPERLAGLTTYNQIHISLTDLRLLSLTAPAKRVILENWVAAGGCLLVHSLGDYSEAKKIRTLLLGRDRVEGLVSLAEQEWRTTTDEIDDFEKLICVTPGNRNRYGYYSQNQQWTDLVETNLLPSKSLVDVNLANPSGNQDRFIMGSYLNGRIVAVKSNMHTWAEYDWKCLNNGIAIDSIGLSDLMGANNFEQPLTNYSVPGVGEPPVAMFRILITLFIFLAGPVMYIVLRRTKRLQLLFVLVPLLSLVSCVGLVGYAILVDGFDSWGRVDSVTRLDQTVDSAVTYARCAYYSGSQPGPYGYEKNTISIIPNARYSPSIFISQQGDSSRYTGGEVRARNSYQVSTIRGFECEAKLVWEPIENEDKEAAPTMKVRNLLGAKVLYAACFTDTGFMDISDVEPQKQSVAKEVEPAVINSKLETLAEQLSPKNSSGRYGRFYSQGSPAESQYGYERSVVSTLHEGLGINLICESTRQSGLEERFYGQFPKNRYIAILESFPPVENQIENVNYKKQFHVIIGNW